MIQRAREWWRGHQAVLWRRYHGWATVFWIAVILPAFMLGWVNSVTFVSLLSIWALVSTEWGAYQASRAEVASVERAEVVEQAQVVQHAEVGPTP